MGRRGGAVAGPAGGWRGAVPRPLAGGGGGRLRAWLADISVNGKGVPDKNSSLVAE